MDRQASAETSRLGSCVYIYLLPFFISGKAGGGVYGEVPGQPLLDPISLLLIKFHVLCFFLFVF